MNRLTVRLIRRKENTTIHIGRGSLTAMLDILENMILDGEIEAFSVEGGKG